MKARRVLAAIFALWPSAAFAGPPFLTDDPEPTDTGHWEIYAPLFEAEGRGRDFEGSLGAEINYGAAENVQVTIGLPAAYSHDASGWNWGAGDFEASVKYRFYHDESAGVQVAFFPGLTLPTASQGLGAGHVTALLPVWAQKDFGPWSVFGGGGYAINPGAGNSDYLTGGVALTRRFGERLLIGVEADRQGRRPDLRRWRAQRFPLLRCARTGFLGLFRRERSLAVQQPLLDRLRDPRDEAGDAFEAGAGSPEIGVEIGGAVDLHLHRMHVAVRLAMPGDDIAAGVRGVCGGAIAHATRCGYRRVEQIGADRAAMAVAEHDRGWPAILIVGARARRHGMAIDQHRIAEPCPRLGQRLGDGRVEGAMDRIQPPVQLGARNALAPDRAGAGEPRRNQAETATRTRRLDEPARRQRRRDQRRIELTLLTVEIDLQPGRAGDEGGHAQSGCSPDQPVDQPILQRLQQLLAQPRGVQQVRAIITAGMRHGEDDGRNRPFRSDPEERGERGLGHVRVPIRPAPGQVQSPCPWRMAKGAAFAHRWAPWGLKRTMIRVLLAEDDDSMRVYLARALERTGYHVVAVDNGLSALPLLHSEPFDLLLTDIVMPEMDGIELAQKAAEIAPDIRVMFITGFAAVALKAGRKTPDAKVLSKPFHLRDLVAEVERMFMTEDQHGRL